MKRKRSRFKVFLLGAVIVLSVIFLLAAKFAHDQLLNRYQALNSATITDRHGQMIAVLPNSRGDYARFLKTVPDNFKQALIQREDRFFYFHPGFNPVALMEALLARFGLSRRPAASTLTQQLAKVLLANEAERQISSKLRELFYAVALEFYESKENILLMYSNIAYFGNQARGLNEAALTYFNRTPELLTRAAAAQLAATISAPNAQNPTRAANYALAQKLVFEPQATGLKPTQAAQNVASRQHRRVDYFEAQSLLESAAECQLTLDLPLNVKIREAVNQNLNALRNKSANDAAVVAIQLPTNELVALVGSPYPAAQYPGYQINMALKPRAIGSTIKPLIYMKAFEKGARPYSFLDDREYKYLTALGLPLYPKNFDYQYRGLVTAHFALSNSLNVPAVKTLEFVGLDDFNRFLTRDLDFQPIQPLADYQLGVALGVLEMNLLDLSRYFTIFPNQGVLKTLRAGDLACAKNFGSTHPITNPAYPALVTKILSDRLTGSEQFGLKSVLNLPHTNYALKTGTSRDYRDSWVVGFTPDFLVGVWVGNADLAPMDSVSGQVGAGQIWSDVMNLLYASQYNHNTPFNFSELTTYQSNQGLEFGLPGDNFEKARRVMLAQNEPLITFPHDGDTFLYEDRSAVALLAREPVDWFSNGAPLGQGEKIYFKPSGPGSYLIKAHPAQGSSQTIDISFRVNN